MQQLDVRTLGPTGHAESGARQLPLAVDLDGTLLRSDMLHESALRALRDRPLDALLIPYWTLRGKAFVKHRLAGLTEFDPSTLPYHEPFLDWLRALRADGRPLTLCTASDASIASAVSKHLGIFDDVMSSDGVTNLSGTEKADALARRFGERGFDYAGNEMKDLSIWRRANRAIVVSSSEDLVKEARKVCEVDRVFTSQRAGPATWMRTLRVHQWLKNLLLFVPLFAAHRATDWASWPALLVAFCSFSLCASSVYIANDLFDLDSDRQHARKRNRPFAAGLLPVGAGVLVAPALIIASFLIARHTTVAFAGWLAFYFVLTCAYSWLLKRLVLVDCLTLAMLYTVRTVAGAAAVAMPLSSWLLAFAVFLFLSLAFVKRYAEIETNRIHGKSKIKGRGYYTSDASLIQALGIASGYAAVLVLALYLNTDTVLQLYKTPEFMWAAVPVTLFWISWIWLKAHRGEMHDDPMVFAMKDRVSLLTGAAFGAVLFAGSLDIAW